MRRTRRALIASCIGLASLWGCATPNEGSGTFETESAIAESLARPHSLANIAVTRTLHFEGGTEGSPVMVEPGTYGIEQSSDSAIVLTLSDGTMIQLEAQQGEHEEKIGHPVALAEESSEDEVHIVILLEDGKSLDAMGSYSGITERGRRAMWSVLSKPAIAAAHKDYQTNQLPPGSPPSTAPAPPPVRRTPGTSNAPTGR